MARIILFTLIFSAFFNTGYSFSNEYMKGYVACFINDLIPEEELAFDIDNEKLNIQLLKRDLDPSTKDKLIQRLKKTHFFKEIYILML